MHVSYNSVKPTLQNDVKQLKEETIISIYFLQVLFTLYINRENYE